MFDYSKVICLHEEEETAIATSTDVSQVRLSFIEAYT